MDVHIFGAVSCTIGVIIIVIFLIRPTTVPRTKRSEEGVRDCLSPASDWLISKLPSWFVFPLDYSTVPVMVVLALWAMQVIGISDIWLALKGHPDSNLKPYNIIILFFTLAYMSLSLDVTGMFDFIAVKSIALSNGSGVRLFLIFFALSSVITIVTSNDIVILTLTPIICSMAHHAHLPVLNTHAMLFAQFFAANIWSMLLFIGNPTNIVVAETFQLSFLGYSKWMAIPTVAAGLTCLLVLYFLFSRRGALPPSIDMPKLDPWANFKDVPGAIFGSIVFVICILFIATSSSTIKVPLWIITTIGCTILLAKDLFFDWRIYKTHPSIPAPPNPEVELERVDQTVPLEDYLEGKYAEPQNAAPVASKYLTPVVLSRLPWKVAPFVVGVFILVEAMDITGITGLIAKGFSAVVGTHDSKASIFGSIFISGFMSAIACNIVNNQPMTIMFTKILKSPLMTVGPRSLRGAMFATVIGSNLGGNITLVGALAGIMWKSILTNRGIDLSAATFARIGTFTMLAVLAMACVTLYAESVAWT
jgi:Na+/H+ antiporter NhaD/arsenite permease-like protein